MKANVQEVLNAALALNGDDKKYVITVEGNKIITRVKWMDTTFFSPDSITNEMRNFEYIVEVGENGKYKELDKSVSVSKSAGKGGFNFKKSIFIGKEITYDRTVGLGRDNQTGETGIVSNRFYSEEYKAPVRRLLESHGYKRKKGALAKIIPAAVIFAVAMIFIAVALLLSTTGKESITAEDFEAFATEKGYYVVEDSHGADEYIEKILIAYDEQDDYQIEFCVLTDAETAMSMYSACRAELERLVSGSNMTSEQTAYSSNYDQYITSSPELYLVVIRVDDTIIYVEADKENKDEIKEFIDEIGY
ncbi:MAG: hypothetical protein IKY78_00670 [Clostridia bacterium]|nr:hypothetical protein [Clostridia bacterium]